MTQGLDVSIVGGGPCTQEPLPLQAEAPTHAFELFPHGVPEAAAGFEQPLVGSHVPAVWHWSLAAQVTGFVPVHVPLWQVSVCVHGLPSVHDVPSASAGFEQTPVLVLHVPTEWHWSLAVHVTGFAPWHIPLWHVSVCVHALPSLQFVPSARVGLEQAPVLVLQVPAV
jgi:hypothetical protein